MPSPDYIPLGPGPCNEDAAQVGTPNYAAAMHKECRAYIRAIRRKLGPEPEGAQLGVMSFRHEFGTCFEVVCRFDHARPAAVAYALRCEREAPETWGEVGMRPPLKFGRQAHGR